jgi:hypothetical protein
MLDENVANAGGGNPQRMSDSAKDRRHRRRTLNIMYRDGY